MTLSPTAVLDRHGLAMFRCRLCGAAVSTDDFFEIGLRLPEPGESADDYCDAELIDGIDHVDCQRPARAGCRAFPD